MDLRILKELAHWASYYTRNCTIVLWFVKTLLRWRLIGGWPPEGGRNCCGGSVGVEVDACGLS